jgi:uncharacterized protein (TIGR02147 family)
LNIFETDDYRPYLIFRLGEHRRTGAKSAAAVAIGCHTTYLSQILGGRADLSLEQADLMNTFLGHAKEEAEFFLLLVLKARAGTASLRAHFAEQIAAHLQKRTVIQERIKKSTRVSSEDESRFYSSWAYGVVHVLVSIPELRSREAVAAYLKLPLEKITEILEFLERIGMIERRGEFFQHSTQMVHLGRDSANIVKHHLNWRLRSMRAIEEKSGSELHYSAAISLSREDAMKIKQLLVDSLQKNLEIIGASKEEVAYGYAFDFFELKA